MSHSAPGSAPGPTTTGTTPPPAEPGAQPQGAVPAGERTPQRGEIPHTRTAVAFNALIAGTIVLILLLVFILENTQSVKISYFGAGGHIALGVALLIAAIGGALLTGLVGAARIVQLRRRVRRRH